MDVEWTGFPLILDSGWNEWESLIALDVVLRRTSWLNSATKTPRIHHRRQWGWARRWEQSSGIDDADRPAEATPLDVLLRLSDNPPFEAVYIPQQIIVEFNGKLQPEIRAARLKPQPIETCHSTSKRGRSSIFSQSERRATSQRLEMTGIALNTIR